MSNSKKRRQNLIKMQQRPYYSSCCIQGYTWARFFGFVGGRGAGKSTDIQRFLVKQWKTTKTPFIWLRLTDIEIKKIKQDNCKNAFEPIVVQKYPELENLKLKGDNLYCNGELLCQFKSLSTFHNDKGTALFDATTDKWIYIMLDEMNKVEGARASGDICYQFKNMVETITRNRTHKIKIFMIGNVEGMDSMLAGAFNWLPIDGKFGIYKLKSRKCVIHYFDDTEAFKELKKNSTSSQIGDRSESTFSNKIILDKSNLDKKARLLRPTVKIVFPGNQIYCEWASQNDDIFITKWRGQPCARTIAMAPHLDAKYNSKERDFVKKMYNSKIYKFKDLSTQELFKLSMKNLTN